MSDNFRLSDHEKELIACLRELFTNQKICFYLDEAQNLARFGGYIPSVVVNGLTGHQALTMPLVLSKILTLGNDQETAVQRIIAMNESLGLAAGDVAEFYKSAGLGKNSN